MKRVIHKIKIFFLKIKWYFENLRFALLHAKQVKNYNFLADLYETAYNKLLEVEKTDPENHKDIDKLKIQLELISKILKYVK